MRIWDVPSLTYGQIRVFSRAIVKRRGTELQNAATATRFAYHSKRRDFSRFINSLYRGGTDDGEVLTKEQLMVEYDFVDQSEGGRE